MLLSRTVRGPCWWKPTLRFAVLRKTSARRSTRAALARVVLSGYSQSISSRLGPTEPSCTLIEVKVQADQVVSKLIGDINEDLEHVLNLRERCATLYGLHLKQETVESVEEMQRLLKSRLLQL